MCTGNEAENALSPVSIAKKSEVAERSHGSKFRSASTDRPASAHAGLADVACDVCDQAWHCQPGEVPLPRVISARFAGALTKQPSWVAVALAMEHAGAEIDDLIFDRVSAFERAGSRHQQPTINRRRPGASSCKALADLS